MDFDFTTETITPDTGTLLSAGSTGAFQLPSGTTTNRPGSAVAGAMRWNTTVPQLEYYNGSSWASFSGVTTFSAGTTGLTPNTATSGAITLAGTLNLTSGGTNASLTAVAGAVVFSTSSAMALTAAGTTGQVLTSAGTGTPTWSTVGAASYSTTVGPSGSQPWVLVSGNTYNAAITHNLGTQNVVVQCADISNNDVVSPDLIVITSASVVTITVIGNTRTLRVVIIANGASIAAGGSTPSSVIVQNSGVGVSGGPFTTLNFTNSATAVTGAGGVATINNESVAVQLNGVDQGSPFSTINFAGTTLSASVAGTVVTITDSSPAVQAIRSLTYIATSLDSPNNADWKVNALAATVPDPTNNAITVRQFSNSTEQGVGTIVPIPSTATNISFTYQGRPQTAPGTASTLVMNLYTRFLVNPTTPAAVGTWSSANAFTSVTVPTNAFYSSYTYTATLAALSLTAGNTYQFELTRAASGVASNWLMVQLTVSFT